VVIAAEAALSTVQGLMGKQPPSLREQKALAPVLHEELIFRLESRPFEGQKTANLKREAGMIGTIRRRLRQIRVDRLMQLREDNGPPGSFMCGSTINAQQ